VYDQQISKAAMVDATSHDKPVARQQELQMTQRFLKVVK
jgi:hypothetical protein